MSATESPHESAELSPDTSPRHGMVGWYDPLQLLRTGLDVAVASIFGRHADHRAIEALVARKQRQPEEPPHVEGEDFWLDYVADVGDGWNSTYAVAHAIAQPALAVAEPKDPDKKTPATHTTQRGTVLILGGDQVYPVANRTQYQERLVNPYRGALRETKGVKAPYVRAIPGNHDWYDSLSAFSRLFMTREYFAGWRAKQRCSYFGLKLPYGWWLLGTDVQLDSDIDFAQLEYFKRVAKYMAPEDRVILCTAEPHWIYSGMYAKVDTDYNENNLRFLEDVVLKRQVSVFLAGDLHHYRRHAGPDQTQKITAGGGGAFLHPTHGSNVNDLKGDFKLKASFPTPSVSWWLGWRNLLFPLLNPYFGILTAVAYMLTAGSALVDLSPFGVHDFGSALARVTNAALNSQISIFWITLVIMGFWLFTDTHFKTYRFIAGTLHSLAHLFAAFLIGWGANVFTVKGLGLHFRDTGELLLSSLIVLAGGWLAGSLIMGVYLFISLNVFGRHGNEAFSALRIADWKHFIRMKFSVDGRLTIYPIGIRRVPRKWRHSRGGESVSVYVSDDSRATPPELIEAPVTIDPVVRHK